MLSISKKMTVLAVLTSTLAGCANGDIFSGDVYTADRAKQVQTVTYGTIQSVRHVKIQAEDSGLLGTVGGAVVGGLLGSTVGGGTGRSLAAAGGAIAGAVAGKTINDKINQVNGVELEIRKENGEVIAVVQKADPSYREGARVRMSQGNGKVNVAVID